MSCTPASVFRNLDLLLASVSQSPAEAACSLVPTYIRLLLEFSTDLQPAIMLISRHQTRYHQLRQIYYKIIVFIRKKDMTF